jgi:hypothetical protein
MGNGGKVEPYVPQVHLNDDDSVDLVVQLVGFGSGSWADISGYITQENGVFAPFSAIQEIPDPVNGVSSLTVNVPKVGLVPGDDVNVITRVTEVRLWPTALQATMAESGVKASWQAKSDNSAPALNDPQDGQPGSYAPPAVTGQTGVSAVPVVINAPAAEPSAPGSSSSSSDVSFTVKGLQSDIKFVVTVEAEPRGESGGTTI